jgi:hypothetical protein
VTGQKKTLPTCVNVSVLLHVGLLVEPLSAVLTGVWPCVRVDEEVRGERGAPLERLSALLAAESALAGVNGPEREEKGHSDRHGTFCLQQSAHNRDGRRTPKKSLLALSDDERRWKVVNSA